MTFITRFSPLAVTLAAVLAFGAVPARAEDARSPALAPELVKLMQQRQLDAFAASDPDHPGHFVAAMAFPEVQILLVAAKAGSADYVKYQLDQQQYREVYSSLYLNAVPDSKLFIQDIGADGLLPEQADIMYERGTVKTLLDGHWKESGLSQEAYLKKQQKAEADYSRSLSLLLTALRAQPQN